MSELESTSIEESPVELEKQEIRPEDIDISEPPRALLGSCEFEDLAYEYICLCQKNGRWEISMEEFIQSLRKNPHTMKEMDEFLNAWMGETLVGEVKAVPLLIELYHKRYPRKEEEQGEIVGIITAKGSFYRYNPDGTTQRYKTIEQKEYEPQTAIVFVPDYETIRELAPSSFDVDTVLGKNGVQYKRSLLENIYREGSPNYIVNAQGTKLDTKEEIERETEQIFLTFGSDGKVDFSLPVSTRPKIGYYTFDTRRYYDPQVGEWKREKHLGNKVIEIRYK